MDEIAIRVPSVESLFDEWSAEPLESRPLSEEARSRILDAWVDGDGRQRISIISDDNHSILQRNLYLEFILTGN